MMFTAAFLALIPFVAALPSALPSAVEAANNTEVISPQIQGNVFVCTNSNFAGICAVFSGGNGQCVNLPASFNDVITAVGPDPDQNCFFYLDGQCLNGQLGPIRSPGIADLNVGTTVPFNDHISSFRCIFG